MPELVLSVFAWPQMTCGGCSGAVERVLKKTEGAPPAFCAALWSADRSCPSARPPLAVLFFVWRSVLFCAGVSSYEVSLEKQEVLVNGTIGYEDLLEKIKKTGKEVRVPRCVRGSWVC